MNGIKLVNQLIEKDGHTLEYKVFSYSRKNPFAILSSVKAVKNWSPDVILEPRNSNMFLLIQDAFKNILVLSPFATSDLNESMSIYSEKFID